MRNPASHSMVAYFLPLLAVAASPPAALAQWATNGAAVCTLTGNQSAPAITSDGANGAVLGWADSRFGSATDIFAQRVSPTGTALWSGGGVAVCTASGAQRGVAVLRDFASGGTFFWTDTRDPSGGVYAQRLDASGLPMWTLNGVALSTHESTNHDVVAIQDNSPGTLVPRAYLVAWCEEDLAHDRDHIRIQRVDVTGQGLWTSAAGGGNVVCASQSRKVSPAMTTDGVGPVTFSKGAVLAWSEDRATGSDDDVYVRRVNNAGTPQWTANGIPLCALPGDQVTPDIANVGADDVVVVWVDSRTTQADLYAQKLDSTGAQAWLADGLPVCRATSTQNNPSILRDGAGGAFVAWVDQRSGPAQIFAQRLDANGQPLWTLDGIAVCTLAAGADRPKLMSDAAGGFIATWKDLRNDSGDIFAQRVDASGNLMWAPSGAPLCVASGTQNLPVIVAGANGMIAAWQDARTGTLDIYANQVSTGGGVSDAPVVGAAGSLLSLLSENPTRGAARFRLSLPDARSVAVDVHDVSGRRVRSLAAPRTLGAGTHTVAWDGDDDSGAHVPAGVYFVRLTAGLASEASRVVVVR